MTKEQLTEFYKKRGLYGEDGFGKVIQSDEIKIYKDGDYIDNGMNRFNEDTSKLVIKELNRLTQMNI